MKKRKKLPLNWLQKRVEGVLRYFLFIFMFVLSDYIYKFKNKLIVKGKENIPKGGNILFLCNHETLADSLCVNRNIIRTWDVFFNQRVIAYNAPDRKNFFSHPIKGKIVQLLKCVPVDRGQIGPEKLEEQFDRLANVLIGGNNLLTFFEGTRSKDGNIGECKKGVPEVIFRARPNSIIPIRIKGLNNVLPRDTKYYTMLLPGKRHKCQMIIGKPIDFSYIINDNNLSKKEKNDEIRKIIRQKVEELN